MFLKWEQPPMAPRGAWLLAALVGACLSSLTFLRPAAPRGVRRLRTARAAEKDAVDAVLRTVSGMNNDDLERLVEVEGEGKVKFGEIHGRDGIYLALYDI
jgi:hypothetical protein